MRVDTVKQGQGTTNNGNTARSFFRNFKISSEITGINQNLIRFAVILRYLKINVQAILNLTAKRILKMCTIHL